MKSIDFGVELNALIPDEREILVGKTKDTLKKVIIYPYTLADLKKISMMLERIVGLFIKSEKKEEKVNFEDFVENNLDKVARVISVAMFPPTSKVTEDELNKKTDELMEEITLKQMVFGFNKVMEVNDASFLLRGIMGMFQNLAGSMKEKVQS